MKIADRTDAGPSARLRTGPGLAKASLPLLRGRTLHLISGSDPRWSGLFQSADIVSEGAPSGKDPDRIYYGSTNIVLDIDPDRDLRGFPGGDIARLLALDPHLRVRALRAARREAAQRASGPLDTISAELSVQSHPRGIAIHIELEGRVMPERRLAPRAASTSPESTAENRTDAVVRVGSSTPTCDGNPSPDP